MLQQTKPISAALYCRLSKDDDGNMESQSIKTQREMLAQYTKDMGFPVYDWYIDDGWSGTNFERPAFERMLADIIKGHVNMVITKDLSRFGRNYLAAGEYIEEFFPEHGVRYIAVNDMVDTKNGYNEFASLKNMFNDWYSMDISRKIKAAFKTKARQGLFTSTYAPYGYLKDPDNHHHLIPDPQTAPIVQRIFDQAVRGIGIYSISHSLFEERILAPRAYWNKMYGAKLTDSVARNPYHWPMGTIRYMLGNGIYLGQLESGKWATVSHKNRKQFMTPKESWIVVPNTHEPLVDEITFELAQNRVPIRKRKLKDYNSENIFSGLLRCADCNRSMSFSRKADKTRTIIYNCARYRTDGKAFCSAHYVRFDVVYALLLEDIRQKSDFALKYESQFLEMLLQFDKEKRHKNYADDEKELLRMEERSKELDILIQKIYEDNALGKLSDSRYVKMALAYETEQKETSKLIAETKTRITEIKSTKTNFSQFAKIVRKYTDITELTKSILNELIEKVIIHECEYVGGERTQRIDVYYNFVGLIPS